MRSYQFVEQYCLVSLCNKEAECEISIKYEEYKGRG